MRAALVPAHHVCDGQMEASLRYPVGDPPDAIELDGVLWVRARHARVAPRDRGAEVPSPAAE